jgi:hypothetical protein
LIPKAELFIFNPCVDALRFISREDALRFISREDALRFISREDALRFIINPCIRKRREPDRELHGRLRVR